MEVWAATLALLPGRRYVAPLFPLFPRRLPALQSHEPPSGHGLEGPPWLHHLVVEEKDHVSYTKEGVALSGPLASSGLYNMWSLPVARPSVRASENRLVEWTM